MSVRCANCQAPVPSGVEVCETCRPPLTTKTDSDSGSGPTPYLQRPAGPLHPEDVDKVPFCGRGPELERLLGLVERVLTERKLRCALVVGAPGLGKTRLLRELSRLCTDRLGLGLRRDRILTGTMPGEAASAVSALAEQLRTRCEIQVAESAQSTREKILRTCRMLLPAVRATEVAHCLGDLLGVPFSESSNTAASSLTPANTVERAASGEPRTYVALKRFLAADAARSPLILLFDEMEHATEETLSLLHYLLESLTELPVFVGLFARPEFLEQNPDIGSTTGSLLRIELSPMPPAEATELFCAAVNAEPEEVPAGLLQHIEAHAEGSPRRIVELYHLLVESGALSWTAKPPLGREPSFEAAWDLSRLQQLQLPPRLELPALCRARLAAMDPVARELLEKAAVCGEHFYLDALLMLKRCEEAGLAAPLQELEDSPEAMTADPDGPALDDLLASGDRAAMLEAVEHLIEQGLLRWVRDSRLRGEREYRFAYPPWRDIVYEAIPSSRRRRLHHLYGHWLLLHRERYDEGIQEQVARHMERAGKNAAAAFLYRRVATMATARGAHAKVPRLLLRALACLGSTDIGLRVALWHDLGAALVQKGDYESAFGAYQKLLRLAHTMAMRHHLALAHHALGQLYRYRSEPTLALEHLNRAFDEWTELSDAPGISDSLDDLGQVLWLLGRTNEALDRAGRSLELRRRLGDRRKMAASLLHIGAIEQHRGLLDPAVSCYEEAIRKSDGDPQLLAACFEALGSIDLLRGNLETARARFEEAIGLIDSLGPSPLLAILLCRQGEVLLQEGQLSEAEGPLQRARQLALRLSDRRAMAEIQRLLGMVLLRRNQHKAALDCCQKALDQAQRNGLRHEIARALLTLGEVHATTLFDETVEGAHPAWDYFRRSVTLLREVGDQAELAGALYQFGRHLIERGRVGPARNTLKEAEQIASRLQMRVAVEMHQMLAEL